MVTFTRYSPVTCGATCTIGLSSVLRSESTSSPSESYSRRSMSVQSWLEIRVDFVAVRVVQPQVDVGAVLVAHADQRVGRARVQVERHGLRFVVGERPVVDVVRALVAPLAEEAGRA